MIMSVNFIEVAQVGLTLLKSEFITFEPDYASTPVNVGDSIGDPFVDIIGCPPSLSEFF